MIQWKKNCITEEHLKGTMNVMTSDDMVREMLAAMSRNGWRITEQRRTLAQIFARHDGYLSPKEVYEQMCEKYPGVSLDTIYRNLRMLSEMGVLEQVYFEDGGLKFKASCDTRHHHHLICLNCEKTLSIDYCPMEQQVNLPQKFKIVNHRFEIYGVCEDCQTPSSSVN